MKKTACRILLLLVFTTIGYGQNTITLETCYENLEANYPLAKQQDILARQNDVELAAIKSGTLPQLTLNVQATYQSDVIAVSIPGSGIEPLNKDQYRTTLNANQLIYNGGKIKAAKSLQNTRSNKQRQEVKINLYQLRQRVNQLYFSVLLTEEKLLLSNARTVQLKSKLNEVRSGIKNGVLLPTSDKIIESELLKTQQQINTANIEKSKLIHSLSALIGTPINDETEFKKPIVSLLKNSELNRPELDLFTLQKEEIDERKNVLSKAVVPVFKGFATGGYGNPGLNMLENDFQAYYLVGLQLNWKVFDWSGNKKKRQVLDLTKELIDNQEEVFRLNTNTALAEQNQEIAALESTIGIDKELIALQRSVVETSDAQLKNGVITASEYVTELTKLYEAENLYNQHKTQLALAKANYNTIKGYHK